MKATCPFHIEFQVLKTLLTNIHKIKSPVPLGSIDKRLLSRLANFGGWECWVNPLKKENSWRKSFFLDNVEWNSKKLWEMISADTKANKNKKFLSVFLSILILFVTNMLGGGRGGFS